LINGVVFYALLFSTNESHGAPLRLPDEVELGFKQ
jgi:hypothetical protein